MRIKRKRKELRKRKMAVETEGRAGPRGKREGWRAIQGLSSHRVAVGTATWTPHLTPAV